MNYYIGYSAKSDHLCIGADRASATPACKSPAQIVSKLEIDIRTPKAFPLRTGCVHCFEKYNTLHKRALRPRVTVTSYQTM